MAILVTACMIRGPIHRVETSGQTARSLPNKFHGGRVAGVGIVICVFPKKIQYGSGIDT